MTIRVLMTRQRPAPMQKLANILLTTLLTSATTVAVAAPVAYSINSDSASAQADSLYQIDLATGQATWIAPISSFGESRIDVEGLAFAPDGQLYGIDDSRLTLFPLNPDNGLIQTANEVPISGLPFGGGNDVGMSFTCGGDLFVTSVTRGSLYRMTLDGKTTLVGSEGRLGANISALAAYGENPVTLYGLGNGLDGNLNTDTPSLFSIDTATGIATEIGPLGAAAGTYSEGGLAFDDNGQLWAITDRRGANGEALPSQVMKLDINTGTASEVQNTTEAGFESLAITVPRGCGGASTSSAQFKVEKQFLDGNNNLSTTLNISCTSGIPLEQSFTTQPGSGLEVTFTVTEFQDGALDCHVWETTPDNYTATFECFSTGECSTTEDSCYFTSVSRGQDNLCVIRNYPGTAEVTVTSEWLDDIELLYKAAPVNVDLICRNLLGGDGTWSGDEMIWSWAFVPGDSSAVAMVEPGTGGATECRTTASTENSAAELESNCEDWTYVFAGGEPLTCTISNTTFFEGIPTLNRGGLLITVLLMLATGLVFVRRF